MTKPITLTDKEIEAIKESMRQIWESDCISIEDAQEVNTILNNLLERTKEN